MTRLFFIFLLLSIGACQNLSRDHSSSQPDPVMNELAVYALSLSGTPYKYGGSTPETGFDCSGFVGHVFQQSIGKSLPRSTDEISRFGTAQHLESLMPGDLVFYNTLNKDFSHVGIYLGDGKFVHSPSTGKSVTTANMNDTYWRSRYNGARRVKP